MRKVAIETKPRQLFSPESYDEIIKVIFSSCEKKVLSQCYSFLSDVWLSAVNVSTHNPLPRLSYNVL